MSFTSRVSRSRRARRGVPLIAAAAGLLAGAAVLGQQQEQPPTFRSGVQLVEVDVRVFDRNGKFIADLGRDDFEVLEEGKPQRVAAMYLVDEARSASRSTTAAAPAEPAEAPAASPAAAQTWIFVFDLNHLTPGGGFDRARKAVEDFIRERFRDGDLAGVVAGDRMVNNRLTSVREELLGAVNQVKPRSESRTLNIELTRQWPRFLNEEEAIRTARNEAEVVRRVVGRACSDDPDACKRATVDAEVMEKARQLTRDIQRTTMQTLGAINALASGLARVPGPKTIVFLSDGFAVQDVETTLRSVVGQAARAGARVYAIDVRGLNRGSGSGNTVDRLQADDPYGAVNQFDSVEDGPNSLAVDTGGMMIRNENNIGRALQQIAEDAGRYYVLAYQPENTTFDGKYRRIEVRVKREDVRVRTRRGYLAVDPARMLKPTPITSPGGATNAPQAADDAIHTQPADERAESSPEPPAPVATGTTVGTSSDSAAGVLRLRPDRQERAKELEARAGPSVAPGRVTEGWEAYQRGDVEGANAALSAAARSGDVAPWVHYVLGMTQVALNATPEAIVSWERVRKAEPDFQPVYMDLADAYAQSGDLTRALGVLREAEKRWPSSPDVLSAIGVVHVRRGAVDDGLAALTRAAELNPGDPLAHLNVARAHALRYHRGRRYVGSQRRWVAPEGDRVKALESYRRCVSLGGPYAKQASEELNILEWTK